MSDETWKADIHLKGGTLRAQLWYPRTPVGAIHTCILGLMDTRAADDIRITYDFERDGWVISQASRFSWNVDDPVCDRDWQEVAFVNAWARAETPEQEAARLGWSPS